MKVCKGVKKNKTDHLPIAFETIGYDEESGEAFETMCPICVFIKLTRDDANTISEMHTKILGQEDYIAKIESENTKLRERATVLSYDTAPNKIDRWDIIEYYEPVKKTTKKRTKKKTTPKKKATTDEQFAEYRKKFPAGKPVKYEPDENPLPYSG